MRDRFAKLGDGLALSGNFAGKGQRHLSGSIHLDGARQALFTEDIDFQLVADAETV